METSPERTETALQIMEQLERARSQAHFLAYEWQALCLRQADLAKTPVGHVRIRAKLEAEIAEHKFNISSTSMGIIRPDSSIGGSFAKLGEDYRGIGLGPGVV